MQLRIAGARRPVPERRHHQPVARDRLDPARPAPRHRRLALQIAQRIPHRPIVRVSQHRAQRVIADAEQHADAFRRRERQINARPPRAEHPSERRAGRRMLARQHPIQCDAVDRALEPERAGAGAHPRARGLRPADVVVLDARADSRRTRQRATRVLEVVAGLAGRELSDRQHPHGLHSSKPLTDANGQSGCCRREAQARSGPRRTPGATGPRSRQPERARKSRPETREPKTTDRRPEAKSPRRRIQGLTREELTKGINDQGPNPPIGGKNENRKDRHALALSEVQSPEERLACWLRVAARARGLVATCAHLGGRRGA